ncbi:MAG TPA: AAA family ATPase [Candidatus Polarisedimenticolaceae bacterium]|nr:AAA family ATPase [Candidatus Polarisedimenticolaceae bacterium]
MSADGLPPALHPLLRPEAYPHPAENVRLVSTHLSWVLLTGELAYKIKRPVHLPFVDLRDPERRAFFCAEELRLNRRFAPELYLDVVPIVEAGGSARIGGEGAVLEHAVRMRQFPAAEELARLLDSGRISPAELAAFGRDVAEIHAGLPVAPPGGPFGEPARVRAALLENFRQCREAWSGDDAGALEGPLLHRLAEAERWLPGRLRDGFVRECHGDLHAENVVRLGGRLRAFDGMEFEPAFRWIDVAQEIGFLTGDLGARGARDAGHAFLSGYLERSGDYAACRLLPLYQAHGCLVRAKVSPLRGDGMRPRYLAEAAHALAEKRPGVTLMSGVSGSGKTWLAKQLAARLRAVHLRSDVERRRLPELRAYTSRTRAMVYLHLLFCAEAALMGGLPVVVDATFVRREDRGIFRQLATRLRIPLHVVRCQAPPQVLRERIAARAHAGNDPSEANLAVLEMQEIDQEPIAPDEGLPVIEADTTRREVVEEVVAALRV